MTFSLKLIPALLFGVVSLFTSATILGVFGLIIMVVTAIICIFAPSNRKAWGRGSLIAGLLFLLAAPLISNFSRFLSTLEMQTAADEILSQMPAIEPSATFTITSVEVISTVPPIGIAYIILGAILTVFGLVMEFGKRRTSQV